MKAEESSGVGMKWYECRRVALDRCGGYDRDELKKLISAQMKTLGIGEDFWRGRHVVIKPNLVGALDPNGAAVTHPAVVEAAAEVIIECGGEVLLAESPGGLYSEGILRNLYEKTGIAGAAARAGFALNFDTSSESCQAPKGEASKLFELISPILRADVIVDISKLKSHTLTLLSNSAKNLFGCIPGTYKAEQHARFRDQNDFMRALVDLTQMICDRTPCVCITDAIVCMEGNGPTGGRPKSCGALFSSLNPFAADLVGAHLIKLTDENGCAEVNMLRFAAERGLVCGRVGELDIVGADVDSLVVQDFLAADTRMKKWFSIIPSWLAPRPQIDRDICVGCGHCAAVCPPHAITMKGEGKARLPHIDRSKCIRCFCCQELCPKHAVKVHKNAVFKLIK